MIVKFMLTVADWKPFNGDCRAVMTVVPTPMGVTSVPETLAIPGSDEEILQEPGEVDVGSFKLNDPTLSRETERSANDPKRGLVAVITREVCVVADRNVVVGN